MSIEYNKSNVSLAKNLRKNATPQENHLWYDFLAKYEIRFQRQKAIDNFIADFYCHQAKLVIELDGSQHFEEENTAADGQRDTYLKAQGLSVLRIPNNAVTENFPGVCEQIDLMIKERSL